MGLLGSPFPRPSLSYCERDRSDEPVRILYSAEPSVGSKRAIGCSNILSFGKPLEGLKAGNRRSNNRTIYVRMRLIIYLFIYLTLTAPLLSCLPAKTDDETWDACVASLPCHCNRNNPDSDNLPILYVWKGMSLKEIPLEYRL